MNHADEAVVVEFAEDGENAVVTAVFVHAVSLVSPSAPSLHVSVAAQAGHRCLRRDLEAHGWQNTP